MAESLYRAYSLEKSSSNGEVITSGSLTTWNDRPVSSLDVGDSFKPIPNGPTLTVKKVNISDKVIGTVAGKPVRQWQVLVEGDNQNETSSGQQTHIFYNFQFDADEHSGTMEVTNTGDNPAVTLDVGDLFNVPGVGRIPCVNIKGSDSYDDNGNHVWSVIYEGSDAQEAQDTLPKNRHSFSIDQDDNAVIHSGSIAISSKSDSPSLSYQVGDKINIPGIGRVTCTRISANDEYSDSGAHIWTVTYEGSDGQNNSSQQGDTLPEVKYSFSIDKDGTASVMSGSMQVVNAGDKPVFSLNVGGNFTFPGIGSLTCVNIFGSDEYTDSGTRIWTITYEGTIVQSQQTKYSLSLSKDGASTVSLGSIQTVNDGEAPALSYSIGDTINIPGLGNITCVGISANDEISEGGIRRWTVTYEGANEFSQNTKYSFTIDRNGNSCSVQVTNEGDAPALNVDVGGVLDIPCIGKVTCTSISASDEYTDSGMRLWTVIYESTPEQNIQTQSVKYSLNIDKNGDSAVQSGSMQAYNSGDEPDFSIKVGETFEIPGLGEVVCTGISASDEYSEDGTRVWNVTYESISEGSTQTQPIKYSLNIDKDGELFIKSGSKHVVNEGETPTLDIDVGGTFNIPGLGEVTCTRISASDEYSENGAQIWNVTYETSNKQSHDIKYSFTIDKDGEASVSSGSMQVTNTGNEPVISTKVGETFNIPGLGDVTCTNITVSDEYSDGGLHVWNVTYESKSSSSASESSGGDTSSMPEDELSVSYELNGSTAYTVSGDVLVLRRSENPIMKKSITKYTDSQIRLASPGSTYEGGIVLSESIVKETIKNNNVVTKTYYKHTIEIEGTDSGSGGNNS